MNDMMKLIDVLTNQQRPQKPGDWDPHKIEVNAREDGKHVLINDQYIGFVFDDDGNFKYLFNWKE